MGQIAGGPIHAPRTDRPYLATSKLADDRTVWALDASAGNSGAVFWSRDVGGSSTPPAFAALDLASIFGGTISGRVYRLRTSDGDGCWATRGTGRSDATGDQEFFCTSTDVRASTCEGGNNVIRLWVMAICAS